jgi:hypothetical protein
MEFGQKNALAAYPSESDSLIRSRSTHQQSFGGFVLRNDFTGCGKRLVLWKIAGKAYLRG